MNHNLLKKYNTPGPRYTSYPTVPYWDTTPTQDQWKELVKRSFNLSNDSSGISVYMHLPFCETQCYYCGCNTRITHNHRVEEPYLQYILKEWNLYLSIFESKPKIKEIHIGGGTPTFFSAKNLSFLLGEILKHASLAPNAEFSFEAHPNSTTKQHLQVLFDLGFKRISLGVQDFDINIQKAVNRIQTYEQIEEITNLAREIGYNSVNFDLIYGLPLQTPETIEKTIKLVNQLKPDRIAYYSYAHVPWMKPGQKKLEKYGLPNSEEKLKLYQIGKDLLTKLGYDEIGMDHFALSSDSLYRAMVEKKLHRNFMGYTHNYTKVMVGLGVSSISDAWFGFMQNEKNQKEYQNALDKNILPIMKGHVLTKEDLVIRTHILNLMCNLYTSWNNPDEEFDELENCKLKLREFETDGLIKLEEKSVEILPTGKPYLRNICMAFDARLWRKSPKSQLFSKTI